MAQQKTALIVGMAKSGIAAARLLYENGYRVIINDMKPEIKGLFDALSGIAYEVPLSYWGFPSLASSLHGHL